MHPFDTAMALTPAGDDRFHGATSPAYANMVGPFGGTTGAVLLNAALLHPARLGDPIALTVNFASALSDGVFEIEACPARTNRSTQHWTLRQTQAGVVTTTGTAVFAVRRPTWSAPEAVAPADLPGPDALLRSPGRLPWVGNYDMRFARGSPLAAHDGPERADSENAVWLRDEPPRPLDFASLAALCDCFFPRVYLRRGKIAPIGTVTMTTYFHADAAMLAAQGERSLLGTARGVNFRNGYYDQSAELWNDARQQLASTHQMVYFRD